ncbi:Laminin subunit gamma-1 [Schistosoma haematobium]|uniref:Laminin subunit gamma-1 n=1 Tax=Schistosoma haematobium TaxID=6185 RepID=A0A922IN70_SCHHA|nr:Laminin subunit gamma-1 [Schistosoma haematobium]KAH9583445.1 Laminin subunit gamma-1 [Schistosoma haematobium]
MQLIAVQSGEWRTACRGIPSEDQCQIKLHTLCPFFFLQVVEWIMKTSTSDGDNRINWTGWMQVDDWDFTVDLTLLSHAHQQMQVKETSVAAVSPSVGLNIHKEKAKILKFKTEGTNLITLDGEALEEVETFTYMDSIISEQWVSDVDVNVRIGKARASVLQLKNIWNSK